MLDYTNKDKKVKHNKTGNIGWIVCEYNRVTDNKRITEVKTMSGQKAHWPSSKVA